MTKYDLLVYTAGLYVGVKERDQNRGDMVDKFQSVTKTIGQPWCMSFVHHCIREVDAFAMGIRRDISLCSQIGVSPSVIKTVELSPSSMLKPLPDRGLVAIWRFYKDGMPTSSGHCGIVHSIDVGSFKSIEGNTADSNDVVREGEGVFLRQRSLSGSKSMHLIGFLDPWCHLERESVWIK